MNLFWQFTCVIVFGATCWAVGDILLNGFLGKRVAFPASARSSLAFATGNVALSYFLTGLGFIGGFVPIVLWAVFLAGIGVTIWHIAGKFKESTHSRSTIQDQTEKKGDWVLYSLIVIIGIFSISAVLQAAAPPYLRDSLVYHLLCPKEYLKAGRLVHIEGNIFSAFPKGHEVLMTLLLSISGDRAAQGFSILQQYAAIVELYGLTSLMAGPSAAAICTLAYATVPSVMYFSGCGYVEPALLMSLGGSLLVLSLVPKSGEQTRIGRSTGLGTIALIGFLAGWMPALKYNGLIYLGLIGFVLLWNYKSAPPKEGLTVIGVFSLSSGPGFCWMVWNWVDWGNPVFPMAWFLFGGKGWDQSRALAMSQYFDVYGMGRSLKDYLMLPWNLAFEGRFDMVRFDGAMGPFLIIFLLLAIISAFLLISRRLTHPMMRYAGAIFAVSAAFFVFGTQQVRFWVPSQMLACIFAAPTMGLIGDFMRGKRMWKVAVFLIMAASLAWNTSFLAEQFLKIGYFKPVFGTEQERKFLIRKVPGYPAIEFINQNLPESSRLMCVWTGSYGYYIDRRYYSDTFIEDTTLKGFIHASADTRELSRKLIESGFSHLFLNLSILDKNTKQSERMILAELLSEESRELFRYQSYGVYEIRQQ